MTKDASFNVEVPEDIVERVRPLCLALPEVTVRVDESLTAARSTARSFDVRGRSFCLLVAFEDAPMALGGGTPLFKSGTRQMYRQREVRASRNAVHLTYERV